jgi:hypothetical protein
LAGDILENMSALSTVQALDRFLEPLRDVLTPELAARIAALRADPATQARLDELADRSAGGIITPGEREEYDGLIQAGSLIAILQAKARAVLNGR